VFKRLDVFRRTDLEQITGHRAELDRLSTTTHHLVGNHELYNFHRDRLEELLGGPVKYRYVVPKPGFRFIFLDAYQEAVIGVDETSQHFHRASQLLKANNPNDWQTAGGLLLLFSLHSSLVCKLSSL